MYIELGGYSIVVPKKNGEGTLKIVNSI